MILFSSKTPRYDWLSNFFPAEITDKQGRVWPTSEHLYQGMKSTDPAEQEKFRKCVSAKQAKYFSRKIEHLRSDWEEVKLDYMRRITKYKYTQHADLQEKLLNTENEELVHLTTWHDTFWGICSCSTHGGKGDNWQGKIIMEIREEIRKSKTAKPVIFVFGSNEKGIHGAGAALVARNEYGAVLGIGRGRTGNAYAIPTKRVPTKEQRQIPLDEIQASVNEFIQYATIHTDLDFLVARVGCGLAGYTDDEIGPMFINAPKNVKLPIEWQKTKTDTE